MSFPRYNHILVENGEFVTLFNAPVERYPVRISQRQNYRKIETRDAEKFVM